MVKLRFVKYESTDSEIISSVKTSEPRPARSRSMLLFLTSGASIRDYVKRKLFKATSEEMSSLLKSTSNPNLAGKFSSSVKKPKTLRTRSLIKDRSSVENGTENSMEIEQNEVNEGPSIVSLDSSAEVEEPVVEIKSKSFSKFSIRLSKKKKIRFSEDLTQSLPVPSCSSSISPPSPICEPKSLKWRKMKSKTVKPYDLMRKSKPMVTSGDEKEEEIKESVKWTKKVRKFAIRTCRYLGYGAQMVSPLSPYADIPMPVAYDESYAGFPLYSRSPPYYCYSSPGSVYAFKFRYV